MKRFLYLILPFLPFLGSGQHQDKVDFVRGTVIVRPIPEEKRIEGTVSYEFNVLKPVDSIFLDAKHMDFKSVRLDGEKIKYSNDGQVISIQNRFKEGKTNTLELVYSCIPKQTVYFLGWDDNIPGNEQTKPTGRQVWTQGQGKYTSHWLPSFDDMEEKVEFDLNFNGQFDGNLVIANGVLKEVKTNHKGGSIISFDMQNPMSSYLLAFVIGNYNKQESTSSSGTSIQNYYYPQDSLKVEPTYRYTKEIFDFLENEIGVPYPWQNYKQVPVRDFLYAGMENTGTTIFSDGYVIDSTAFIDKNYVNVNAHELAHQWFGNLVTEKDGNHHWLHEGFATYYAYLAEQHLFGEDYYHWKLFRSFLELQAMDDKGEGQSLLDPKASSLIFYEKGALALHMLRAQIGDGAFRRGIKSYLNQFQFKNVTVSDFLSEMEKSSKIDLSGFKKEWLENTSMPYVAIKNNFVENSRSIKSILDLDEDLKRVQGNNIDYLKYWDNTNSIHLKKYILEKYAKDVPPEIIEKAFAADSLPIRQQLAFLDDIALPKEKYESLLNDKSYKTVENALIRLWASYPKDRTKYLDRTKEITGLPNKNVRLLWLTLATLTDGYHPEMTKQYFDELGGYTSPAYSSEIRQTAFQYLKEAFGFTDQNLLHLIQATTHHAWRFKKFARGLLGDLLEDKVYRNRIGNLANKLKPEEKRYIQTKLK